MSAAEMREALKPCPFCGGEVMPRWALWPSEGDTDAIIHAEPSACPMATFCDGTADKSVADRWNRRAPLPDEEGMVERVADALRDARLTRPSITSRCARMTDEAIAACVEDDLRDDARAAIRAINGGKP